MLIGELAEKTKVSIDTIRYYEREGLIKPVSVRESGYREFDNTAAERLLFVTRAKKLGFSLKEIRDLLALKDNPDTTRAKVRTLVEEKLTDINNKIKTLHEIKQELDMLVSTCPGDDVSLGDDCCSIMDSLNKKGKRK